MALNNYYNTTTNKMTSNVGEVYFFVSATSDSKLNYQWEVSTDFGDTWVYINNDTIYNGANNDTLKLIIYHLIWIPTDIE